MSIEYKNIVGHRPYPDPIERRENLEKEVLKYSSPFPKTLTYEDIDKEFHRWVEEDLDIVYKGEKLPTMDLFSNQRFSEFMQSWQNVDEKGNLKLNFKTISRENNPKSGTLYGETRNQPGERTVLLKRVAAQDHNGRRYYIDYRMKQPFTIDMIYNVSVVTDKIEVLNQFNQMVNDKFKAIDCYIRPNGHYIGMKLSDISDESENSIDDRRYYLQTYSITVMAYIITEDSFIVREIPELKLLGIDIDLNQSVVEVEEESDYPMALSITFTPDTDRTKFPKGDEGLDFCFKIENVICENVRFFKIRIENAGGIERTEIAKIYDPVNQLPGNILYNGDIVKILGVKRIHTGEKATIKLQGHEITCPEERETEMNKKKNE